MLSGPAILRISILLIIAGVLAALVQALLPGPSPLPDAVAEPQAAVQPAETPQPPAADQAARTQAGPGSASPGPARPVQVDPVRAAPAPPTQATGPAQAMGPAQAAGPTQATGPSSSPMRMPSEALAFPSDPAAPPAREPAGEAEIDRAEDGAGPRALALVDLNTAPVADLNRLRGGGTIGRAIVAKRPYASVEQLLSKRVLSRSVYERIKDQVMVR